MFCFGGNVFVLALYQRMNTAEIEQMLRGLPGFLGVFASDEVPGVTPTQNPQCLIVNLDPSWLPGSHWVGICARMYGNKKVLELFDSYGSRPIMNHKKGWRIIYNKKKLQKPETKVCGHYATYFVKNRLKNESFRTILKRLVGKRNPDNYVKKQIKTTKTGNTSRGKQQCGTKPPHPCCVLIDITR